MRERRTAYLRENLRNRWALWAMGIVTTWAVIDGVAARNLRVLLGWPAVTALVILAVAYVKANSRAKSEFFAEVAPTLGLQYTIGGHYPAITPLLSAGVQRRFEHTMEGPLFGRLGGPPCLLAHYTYEMRDPESDELVQAARAFGRSAFTVCAIDIGAPALRYLGLYLRPRLSGLGLEQDWLRRVSRLERVELESVRFNEQYDLRRANDQDRQAVRELFSPSFVAWLNEHPLQPGFECKAGTLVVFMRGHADTAGKITMLHEAAREIARRLAKQLEQDGFAAPAGVSAG